MMKKIGEKKGQVTIFIIIAVLLVAMVILFFIFRDSLPSEIGGTKKQANPSAFIQGCLENEIKTIVDKLALQGGSINPKHYILYQGERIEYLCYTNEYYKPCVMQQPLLDSHVEKEIKNAIQAETRNCFNSMKDAYEKQNYNVDLSPGDITVELLPKRIITKFDYNLVLTKDSSKRYDSFSVILNNNLYELVSITSSILNSEAKYGDTETTFYMDIYRNLKIEKQKQTEGSTIYILTNTDNGEKFQFASRSIAWPPGFGGLNNE